MRNGFINKLLWQYVTLLIISTFLGCATTLPIKKLKDEFFSEHAAQWRIQPGAKISILVQGEPSFSEENITVDSEGTINYKPLGRLKVSQYTYKEFETTIKEYLSKDFFHTPKVSVIINNKAKIYILGEVESPGLFEISHPITVLEAVKLAGNFSNQSQRDIIRIVRQTSQGERIKKISLKKIEPTWLKNEKIFLMPGDLIMVN